MVVLQDMDLDVENVEKRIVDQEVVNLDHSQVVVCCLEDVRVDLQEAYVVDCLVYQGDHLLVRDQWWPRHINIRVHRDIIVRINSTGGNPGSIGTHKSID